MMLHLSRASFWLAAAAAALALLAPAGFERLLMTIVLAASALAFGSWRAAWMGQRGASPTHLSMPHAAVLGESALRDTAAALTRRLGDAASHEAALHGAAEVLRGELGAREVCVHAVCSSDATHAHISDLIESQPGFRTVERRVRLAEGPLGQAVGSQRPAGRVPGPVAVPVLADGQVVAALVLVGIELPIEPAALTALLDLTQARLSAAASLPAMQAPAAPIRDMCDRPIPAWPAGVALVADNAAQPEVPQAPGETQFERIGAGLPGHGERFRELGFDDHLSTSFRPGRSPAMLSRHLRPQGPADRRGSVASAGDGVLDAEALARLTELDPTGKNRLLERVLQAFQTSAARLRPQADAARVSGDRAALRLVAHTLKSSSASIGAMQLSQVCAAIETTIRSEPGGNLDAQLDAMTDALDAALRAIDTLLRARS